MSTTNGKSMLVWSFLGIALVFALIYGKYQYAERNEERKEEEKVEKAKADSLAAVQQEQQYTASVVRQLPDKYTPCSMEITEIRDLYTDGEPIWALPPEWPRSKAIYYSGKGHVVVQGGEIHKGTWEFWSANQKNPKKVVMIRVIGR